jgi:hypothetical protein
MLVKRKSKLGISLEMIDFQTDKFGARIEDIISRLYSSMDKSAATNNETIVAMPEIQELEMSVAARLGFSIKIKTNQALAAVMPFYSQPNHIFIPDQWKGQPADDFIANKLDTVLKSGKRKGIINTKNAVVGGLFSEVCVDVYMNFKMLKGMYGLTPAETTGVFLHELGHAFYAMEYSDRMDASNQILANLAKTCLSKKNNKDTTYIYRELEKINPKIRKEEIDKMMSNDKTIASYSWFKFVVQASAADTSSQMPNGIYNQTSFEQLADNFASRFGYGRQVVLGLDKLHKANWSPEKQRSAWIFYQFMAIASVLASVMLLLYSIGIGAVLPVVVFGFMTYLIFSSSGESSRDYTYDKLKIRYLRVRNDIVEMLKDPSLDKTNVKQAVTNLYSIDAIIKDSIEYNTLLDGFLNIIWTSDRNAGKSIREEQLLEELANNMLFVKAAEIRLMA